MLAALIVLVATAQWRPEERVMVSDFSYVDAVAASPWVVFAATRHGLLIYDRVARAWKPPVTTIDGYPTARVRSAVADESGNAVWLGIGGVDGYVRYDVDARMWTRGAAPPVGPTLTVEAALARAPAADAIRALILTDPRLRSYQFTAAASTPDKTELYFGTNGLGLVRVDPQTGEWEALPYGLLTPGVGAIVVNSGGVWTATGVSNRTGERGGVTWVASDLSATRSSEGGGALGFTFHQAWGMIAARGALWVAAPEGVWRIDPATLRARRFDVYPVMSFAPAPDGVWAAATTNGLFVITDDGRVEPVGERGLVAMRLCAVGDTLWVGTRNGVRRLSPGANVTEPAEPADLPSLRTYIYAITSVRDTLVVATERELVWRIARGGSATWSRVSMPPAIGLPNVLAPDPDGGVWIGGTQGFAHVAFGSPHIRVLTVPMSVPAYPRAIGTDDKYLWVATDSGLVRFDRRAALIR